MRQLLKFQARVKPFVSRSVISHFSHSIFIIIFKHRVTSLQQRPSNHKRVVVAMWLLQKLNVLHICALLDQNTGCYSKVSVVDRQPFVEVLIQLDCCLVIINTSFCFIVHVVCIYNYRLCIILLGNTF